MIEIFDNVTRSFKFRPMLASELFDDIWARNDLEENYLAEEKIDGIRAIVIGRGMSRSAQMFTRTGNIIANKRTPDLFIPEDTILDSELVNSKVYAFDCIRMLNQDVIKYPLHERRGLVKTLVDGLSQTALVMPNQLTVSKQSFDSIVKAGGEGLVVKRISSQYKPATRSQDWIKVKNEVEIDVVIMGLTPSSISGYTNLEFGVYEEGVLVSIGTVKHSKPKSVNENLIGKVAVIRGNKIFESGHVRHPRIIRFRDDKLPQECTR